MAKIPRKTTTVGEGGGRLDDRESKRSRPKSQSEPSSLG